jgi:hypothetical protein
LQAEDGTNPDLVNRLMKAAEHRCIVLQTLQSGVSVETSLNGESTDAIGAGRPTSFSRQPQEFIAAGG